MTLQGLFSNLLSHFRSFSVPSLMLLADATAKTTQHLSQRSTVLCTASVMALITLFAAAKSHAYVPKNCKAFNKIHFYH